MNDLEYERRMHAAYRDIADTLSHRLERLEAELGALRAVVADQQKGPQLSDYGRIKMAADPSSRVFCKVGSCLRADVGADGVCPVHGEAVP